MNKLLTTMLASSVLMMGAMTVAHADDQDKGNTQGQELRHKVASHHKNQHHAAKHHRQHAHNVTTAARHGQHAAAHHSQQFAAAGVGTAGDAVTASEVPGSTMEKKGQDNKAAD